MLTKELIVFFSAMTPGFDIKIAVPIGLSMGLSLPTTLLFAIPGMTVPGAIALAVLGPLSTWVMKKSQRLNIFFTKLFDKTRKKHSKNFGKFGAIFLILFVAFPMPGSGSVGGAIVAFLFGVNYWKALFLISIGVGLAAILVSAGVESITSLFNFIF